MSLSDLRVDIDNEMGESLPVRPLREMVNLKHDARTGTLNLILPDNLDSNDPDAKGTEVMLSAVEFVPLTILKMVKGKGVGSNVSIKGVYDLYKYSNDNSSAKSFGVMSRKKAFNEAGAKSAFRAYGFLRSVDGVAVSKLDNKLSEMYGKNLVPTFMDFTYQKFRTLQDVDKEPEGKILSIKQGKNPELIQHATLEDGTKVTYYMPMMETKELTKTQETQLEKFAKDYIEVVADYLEKVKANDAFLMALKEHGMTQPNTVSTLREDFSISNVDSLTKEATNLADGGDVEKGYAILARKLTNANGNNASGANLNNTDANAILSQLVGGVQGASKPDDDPIDEPPADTSAESDVKKLASTPEGQKLLAEMLASQQASKAPASNNAKASVSVDDDDLPF